MAERVDLGRVAKAVGDARKDGLILDSSRLIATQYAKMVEHFSAAEGSPVSAHNNKPVFLEGIHIWCRDFFSMPRPGSGETSKVRDIVSFLMEPWYEAMSLDDPSRYRMEERGLPPVFIGSSEDVLALALGMAACLDITPIRLKVGSENGEVVRVWGNVQADSRWYDIDVSDPAFALGDHAEFAEYQEMEIPL